MPAIRRSTNAADLPVAKKERRRERLVLDTHSRGGDVERYRAGVSHAPGYLRISTVRNFMMASGWIGAANSDSTFSRPVVHGNA